MNLEDVAVQIRLRNPWESMDLGIRMMQQWWRAILLPWMIIILLLSSLILLLLPSEYWVFATPILWLLKPMLDRPVLYVVSRATFSATPSVGETLRALPQLWWSNGAIWSLLRSLTIGRFDPARSMHLPITQLEGLSGKQAVARRKVLDQQVNQYATGLTVVWIHIESMITLTVYGLLLTLVPHDYLGDAVESLFLADNTFTEGISFVIYVMAMSLIEPIYVASGFSLYLNRRTQLEAWDLELSFRRLTRRVNNIQPNKQSLLASWLLAASLVTFIAGMGVFSQPVFADEVQSEAVETPSEQTIYQRRIAEIMDSPELQHKKSKTIWRLKQSEKTNSNTADLSWLFGDGVFAMRGSVGYILIGLLLLALAIVIWTKREALAELMGQWKASGKAEITPAETLFGLDVRPQSLPDDIPAAVLKLWRDQHHREAMSLLYRAALSRLIHDYPIRLNHSATEGEVLHQARRLLNAEDGAWVALLTQNWQTLAYAHRTPETQTVESLCSDWHQWTSMNDSDREGV